jgi:high-affinity nickel-transport protein
MPEGAPMSHVLRSLLDDDAREVRRKARLLMGLLLAFNIAAWAWTFLVFHYFPLLLGTAFLAYSLGLRHAVDADHIAAIDNVTRKLMQEGKRPVTLGLMFALGHSTIVIFASVMIAIAAVTFRHHLESFRAVGGVIGTAVSALFLFTIAFMNMAALRALYARLQGHCRGEVLAAPDAETLMGQGLLVRLFRPVFRAVSRSWHMYPLGLLFGLGFDTATEIGLLGIAASEATRGLPIWSILVFPVLFTAGMSLVDTADGILMLGAYGWAFVKPVRKIYYNFTITLISVLVALAIGAIEGLGLLAGQLQLKGMFWDGLSAINDNAGSLGFAVIGVFVLAWIVSVAVYKIRGLDDLELQTPGSE